MSDSATPNPDPRQRKPHPEAVASLKLAEVIDQIPFNRAQLWIVILIMAGMLFDTFEQDAIGAIGPALLKSYNITSVDLVTLNTATVIGGLVGRVLAGYAADRWGRRMALSFNLIIYAIGGLASALAPMYGIMLVTRFVVGIGLGGEFTIGLAMVSEMVATRRRGTVIGAMGWASGGIGNFAAYALFALVLGPLNAALGGETASWRWLLGVLAIPALLIVWYRRYLPETPRFLLNSGRIDEANRVLTILASGTLEKQGRLKDEDVTPYLTSAEQAPVKRKVPLTAIVRGPLLRRTIAIGVASWMAFGAQITLLVLLPLLLVSKGYSVSTSVLYTMIMYFGSMLGAGAAALAAGTIPRRIALAVGAVLGCASAICFATLANGPTGILIFGSLFQFFSLFLNTTLALWSPELYPTRVRAWGTSCVNGIGNIAGAVMPFAAVAAFTAFGVAGVFIMIAVMYLILGLVAQLGPETLGRSLEDVNEDKTGVIATL